MVNSDFKTKSYQIKHFNMQANAFQWAISNVILNFENEKITLIKILENNLKIKNNRKILNIIIQEMVNKGVIKIPCLEKNKEFCDVMIDEIIFEREKIESFLNDAEFNYGDDKEKNNIFFVEFKESYKNDNKLKSLNNKSSIEIFNNNEFSEKILTIIINKNSEEKIFIINYSKKNKEIKLKFEFEHNVTEFILDLFNIIHVIEENNPTIFSSDEISNQIKQIKKSIGIILEIDKNLNKKHYLNEEIFEQKIKKLKSMKNYETIKRDIQALNEEREKYSGLSYEINNINKIINNSNKYTEYIENMDKMKQYRDELEKIESNLMKNILV